MDFEAPVDAWYVWIGVVIVSVVLAGVVLSLPSQPPPDATEAANTIDRVTASPQIAEASYEHGGEESRIDTKRIALRNDGGTDHASVAFGSLTPLSAVGNETKRDALLLVLEGAPLSSVLEMEAYESVTETELRNATENTRRQLTEGNRSSAWRPSDGELHVRTVELDGDKITLVAA